jgi:hypothetical protein
MNQPDLTFRNISEKRVEEKNLCEFISNLRACDEWVNQAFRHVLANTIWT